MNQLMNPNQQKKILYTVNEDSDYWIEKEVKKSKREKN